MPTSFAAQAWSTLTASSPSPKATTATSWPPRSPRTSSRFLTSSRGSTTPSGPRLTRRSASTPSVRPSRAQGTSRRCCSRGRAADRVYVIVVGGGTVGYYLSRDLVERGHEVTLIEKDARRADWLETQLGSIVMRGDG